ncbi:hypothetical protein [Flavivirga sp. 57AJ16]|uniref:hypothetical protein n=1 Tax=Flavivirga sp. 57AJ16 TaxID=3025307 RepID=UPI002365C99E|nr:hypothetical protein [Flavivirga sp. 57AJ16]MDD7887860.1 hypothetical protein [Flavivirga sp. 57AJ16]
MKKSIIITCLTVLGTISIHAQKTKKSGSLNSLFGVNVQESHDKFEGTTTYRMTGNKVKINGAVAGGVLKGALGLITKNPKFSIMTTRLQLENHITKDSVNHLAVIFKISLEDNGAFRVMEGESLIFLADGQRIGLSTDGAFNQDDFVIDGDSKTHARYAITQSQIEQIINSEVVEFRIMQDGYQLGEAEARDKGDTSFEGSFSKKNFKAWQDFYENYIINTPNKS